MANIIKSQGIPLALTITTFFLLWAILYIVLRLLNILPGEDVMLSLRKGDILIGLTIYIKTSIDFGIFIGNLMRSNPGWKKRIAIELGTALGNAIGTFVVLIIWRFFRMVPLLMVLMIFLASLVLLEMAEESLEDLQRRDSKLYKKLHILLEGILYPIRAINAFFSPFMSFLIPDIDTTKQRVLPWKRLAFFSFSVPFILGLDDFAGYIPLFNVVNVYGFIIGVFLGHMLLNVFLFLSPQRTTVIVKNTLITLIGGFAFIGIALFGFYEIYHILFH